MFQRIAVLCLLVTAGCAPFPRYTRVTEPPLALRDRTVAVLVFDSSKAQVVAGARSPEEVAELKRSAGTVLAESIALRMKIRLHARAEVFSSVPEDAEYVVTGRIIEIDPGNSTLRVAAGVATAFGVPASGGAGTFRASGEVLRVSGKKLVRVARFRPLCQHDLRHRSSRSLA